MAKRTNSGTRKGVVGVAVTLMAALVAAAAGLLGCTSGNSPSNVTGTDGTGGGAKANETGLTYFSYSFNNSFAEGSYTVEVKLKDDNTVAVTYDINGYDGIEDIVCTADASLLANLEKVYEDQNIASWNGFHGVNNGVMDGSGFGVNMTFKDGTKLSASGSNSWPTGYRDFVTAIEEILSPYRAQIMEQSRQALIAKGTKGNLDFIMATFKQQGTSGSDEYSFFVCSEGVRTNNFDVTIKSDGEFFPAGKLRYYSALPNEAIWFDKVQKLVEKYDVIQWSRWNKAAQDYSNSEWFQLDLTYSEDGYIEAMGTEHPENYDAFRAEFLQLMADMVKNAESNYGLTQYS